MKPLTIIAAVARNGVIGRDNQLLWRLPEDMQRFKALTTGNAVIMGRRTWESLPEKFRPLPNRRNIVVTRDGGYRAAGATVAHSLEEAIAAASPAGENGAAFVIGGGELYALALPLATRLELTEIDADFEGDAHFPPFDRAAWHETARDRRPAGADFPYDFVTYERR
jgi:dihydrofolate reductase